MNNAISRLAKMLKDRENPNILGVLIGVVEAGFPDIKIRIQDNFVLEKDDIIFSAHVLENYERDFEFSGTMDLSKSTSGTPLDNAGTIGNVVDVSATGLPVTPVVHTHTLPVRLINGINIDGGSYSGTGTIKWTDTLVVGDEVILIPSMNNKRFYLVDKGVSV